VGWTHHEQSCAISLSVSFTCSPSQSFTVLIKCAAGLPVHVFILSSHVVFGLPLYSSGTRCCTLDSFLQAVPFFLRICPKYVIVHGCLDGCEQNSLNPAAFSIPIHLTSYWLSMKPSGPSPDISSQKHLLFLHLLSSMSSSQIRTLLHCHTSVFRSRTLVEIAMPWFCHIFLNFVAML